MAKTRANLVERALEKLLIVGSGQSADDEDKDSVDGVVDAVFADLTARDIYTVQDEADIDLAAFEWLGDCLAVAVSPDFGQQPDQGKRDFAESRLKWIGATKPSKANVTADYF